MGNYLISNEYSNHNSRELFLGDIEGLTKKGEEKIEVYVLKSVKCFSEKEKFYVMVKVYLKLFHPDLPNDEPSSIQNVVQVNDESDVPEDITVVRSSKDHFIAMRKDETSQLAHFKLVLKKMNSILNLKYQPNILPYFRIVETTRACYLIRQFCYINLAERISTRPNLTFVTKLWISFQILKGLTQLHSQNFFHGDLKATNVVLNGWDWVFLSDLAPFKPVMLSKDKSRDNYSFFFNNAEKFNTTLAPERLFADKIPSDNVEMFKNKMDVFSAGCVIAQMFLDGIEIFEWSELIEYSKGVKKKLESKLNGIKDSSIRKFIRGMLVLKSKKRFTSEKALAYFKELNCFPKYFTRLHILLGNLLQKNDDQRLEIICDLYDDIVEIIESKGKKISDMLVSFVNRGMYEKKSVKDDLNEKKKVEEELKRKQVDEEKKKVLEKIIFETKQLNEFIKDGNTEQFEKKVDAEIKRFSIPDIDESEFNNPFGKVELGRLTHNYVKIVHKKSEEGIDLVASVLCSSLRNGKSEDLILRGLEVMRKVGYHCNDFTRLQKIVPYVSAMLTEKSSPHIKINAIRTLTFVLQQVKEFKLCETNLFIDFLYSKFKKLLEDDSGIVRICFVENFPLICFELKRFVKEEKFEKNKTDMKSSSTFSTKKEKMADLKKKFVSFVEKIVKDGCDDVRIGLLKNVVVIYLYCEDETEKDGGKMAREKIFPLLRTYAKDKISWRVRAEFFNMFQKIGRFMKKYDFDGDILKLFYRAMYDEEEFVVHSALKALFCLCKLNTNNFKLFKDPNKTLFDIQKRIIPLIYHPNNWIKYDIIAFLVVMANVIGEVDSYCLLIPKLESHFRKNVQNISKVTMYSLLEAVKPSLKRELFNRAIKEIPYYESNYKRFSNSTSKTWASLLEGISITKGDAKKLEAMKLFFARKYQAEISNAKRDSFELVKTVVQKGKGKRGFNKKVVHNGIDISDDGYGEIIKKDILPFKPKGNLFATSFEHGSGKNENNEVTSMCFYEKSNLLVSGAKDFCVRIWDVSSFGMLNKDFDLVSKIRYEINDVAGGITSVCCFPNSPFTVLSTTRGWMQIFDMKERKVRGTIHINGETGKAEFVEKIDKLVAMKLMRSSRSKSLVLDTAVNVVKTFPFYNSNSIFAATQSGKVHVLNRESRREIFQLSTKKSLEQGPITAMCGKDLWIVTGTERGYLTLWDLRFQVPIKSWRINDNPINDIVVRNNTSKNIGPPIYIASTSKDIIEWNLEKQQITSQYRCFQKLSLNNKLKDEKFVHEKKDIFGINEIEKISYSNFQEKFSVNTLFMNEDGGSFFSAGNDRKVRYHDIDKPTNSSIVSGLKERENSVYQIEEGIVKEDIRPTDEKTNKPFDLEVKKNHNDSISCLTVIKNKKGDKKLVSAGVDGVLFFWD